MAKTKISEFSATPANNTDIDSINIAEGCAPSGINDAIRELMAQLKDFQTGAVGDSFNGPIGSTSAVTGAFTTLSATGAITSTLATGTAPFVIASTTKVANLNVDLLDGADWAAPAALGSTTPAAVSATTLSASSTVSGTGFSTYLASPPAIGGTAAAAGSFTTLSATGAVTVFNSSTNTLSLQKGDGAASILFGSNTAANGRITSIASGGLFFSTGDITQTEKMRITADGNVGVGTSSPSAKLDVTGTAAISGAVTLSGGTANGVAYLNGSKVVTSGSALQFDGSGLVVGGSTSAADGGRLTLTGSAGFAGTGLSIYETSTGNNARLRLQQDAAVVVYNATFSSGGNAHAFQIGNNEGMRLTSTGLGIGTSSPTQRLHLAIGSATAIYNRIQNSAGDCYLGLDTSGNTNLSADNTGNQLIFKTEAVERMRLDTSGNLGLGVTPSAWAGSVTSLDISGGGSLFGGSFIESVGVWLAANAFYNSSGNGTYKANGFAPMYNASGNTGAHRWYTSPSGTAGNTISFTQAMTLTAEGNLGIGSTSPTNLSNYKTITMNATTGSIIDLQSAGTTLGRIQTDTTYSLALWTATATPMVFGTNYTERARIDSSGNFQVGFTGSQTSKVNFVQSANLPVLTINNTNASFTDGALIIYNTRATTNSSYNHFACYNGDFTGQFIVRDSGNAVNSNNSYGAVSDIKLKENIVDASPKLDKLNQVRVVNYNLIGSEQKQLGVIAQELEQVFPSMVEEAVDRDKEGNDLGTTTKSVKYSVFVPMLIKAMQEQQAIIESLKARLDAANL